MTTYSKLNIVYRLQKWMDSVAGQTFLNYAYSWGASIVILGTLFKLTHLPGANFFLFLGMGTEVFVFFISAFDRPFDKTTEGMDLDIHMAEEGAAAVPVTGGAVVGGPIVGGVIGGSPVEGGAIVDGEETARWEGGPVVVGGGSAGGGGTVVIGGTGGSGGTVIIGGAGSGDANVGDHIADHTDADGGIVSGGSADGGGVIGGGVIGGGVIGGNVVGGAIGGGVIGGGVVQQPETLPMGEELKEATSNYIDELNRLTEMLTQVSEQSQRLTRDSEEMENLNRTLTGISRVYEMQLKSASSQISTIDEINEQTKHMAEQIQELNRIYARMIEAMQVRAVAPAP
ncbi:MAG: gliding motility protein GldL [Prevotella sp.]|nr:gliding motility protein GldL [Prevotella sp.]